MLQAQAAAYAKLFALFVRHKDAIDRVTFWGLNDARSWRAGQNPLVFDRDNQAKPALQAIVDAAGKRG
jgi:endo-1,4-beta-xylanase